MNLNLFTVLGAAVSYPKFCDALLLDPVRAARLLNITLTPGELAVVKQTFSPTNQASVKTNLGTVADLICKHPPCPSVPAISGLDSFPTEAAVA